MNSAFLSPSVLRPAPKNSSTLKCSYGRSVDCPDIVCLRGRGLRLFVAATDGVLFSPIAVSIHSNREISWSPMLSSTRRSALPKAPSWTGLALDYRCPLRRAVRNRSTILIGAVPPPALNAPAGLVDAATVCLVKGVGHSRIWAGTACATATTGPIRCLDRPKPPASPQPLDRTDLRRIDPRAHISRGISATY